MRTHGRAAILASLFVLLLATPVAAQFGGTWSGPFQFPDTTCPIFSTGTMVLTIAQTGNAVQGDMAWYHQTDNCNKPDTHTDVYPFVGTVSGNVLSMTSTYFEPEDGEVQSFPLTLTRNGTSGVVFIGALGSSTNVTQTSTAPITATSATFIGTYSAAVRALSCTPTTPISYSGALSGTVTQVGSRLAATLTAVGAIDTNRQACTRTTVAQLPVGVLAAEVSGTSVSGSLAWDGVVVPFTGLFDGSVFTVTAADGSNTFAFTITKAGTALPPTATLTASPTTVVAGEPFTISWTTANATSVTISGLVAVGPLPLSGSTTIRPGFTRAYTLTATGPNGTATASVTVTVTQPATPAEVIVSAYPRGMIQAAGGELPTDSYTLTNIGGSTTRLTITQNGAFFTQHPTVFDLQPGASQTIFISAVQQSETVLSAISQVTGTGANLQVPIRMLVANVPVAPVAVTAPEPRADFAAPAGQNPSGQVLFTNLGPQAIQGLLTVDSEWISVPPAVITIGAGQSEDVAISIDRSRRPDSAAPIGGVVGSLTFSYVNAAVTPAPGNFAPVTNAVVAVITKVTIVIVDVVSLNTTTGSVPPLPAGQIGFFIPGATSQVSSGDLLLANPGSAAISDLTIYYAPVGGAPGRFFALGQFKGASGISFPGVVKNIFNNQPAPSGTLHVRSSDLSKVSIAQTQTDPKRALGYALPVLRSDDGIDAGQALFLPGVQSSANVSTSLYLQEMAGREANVTVDFLDAAGAVVRANAATTFNGQTDLVNAVPAGAVTARVTNNSTTGARINGYALVTDRTTNDSYTIVQVGPVTDPMVTPSFDAESGEMFLHLVNSSAAPINVTASTISSGPRRRGVRRSSIGADAITPAPLTIPPLGYTQVRVNASGLVRLTGSNAVRVAGRYSASGIGSGVAALPSSRAATKKTFAGIEDAAPSSTRKLSYRTNLMLVETTGNEVTVQLTLHYVFSSGKVSSPRTTTEKFLVPANGFALITDLAASIIGEARASYGDLHNAVLDIEVTSGSGSVMSFLQVIDNGTGDVTVRHD